MRAPEDTRIWVGGGVAATVLLLAGGWFLLVSPELATVPAQHATADLAQTDNDALQAKVTGLQRQSRNMPALVAGLRTERNELPIVAGLPAFIQQLDAQAATAKVRVTGFAVGAVSVAGGAAAADAGAATASSGDSTSSGSTTSDSSSSGSTSSGSTTGSTAVAATTTDATGAAGQLFQIQLTLITRGALTKQQAFLAALQLPGTRAALVTSTGLAPDQDDPGASLAISTDMTTAISVFVAPQTPADAAALSKQLSARPTK